MHNRFERRVRLALPDPYLLFYPQPNAKVHADIHNPAELLIGNAEFGAPIPWVTRKWALDYGVRPAFTVSGVPQRMPESTVFDGGGSPIVGPPATREAQYRYPYNWTPFAVPVSGAVVPRGREEADVVMPAPNLPLAVQEERVLRFRFGGTVVAGAAVGAGLGTPGPYFLTLGQPNIVPGTVKITAPKAVGTCIAQDLPWPKGDQRAECRYGLMIGDVDPFVDSIIDYAAGRINVTFNANIVIAPILGDFEHDSAALVPLDIFVSWDSLSI